MTDSYNIDKVHFCHKCKDDRPLSMFSIINVKHKNKNGTDKIYTYVNPNCNKCESDRINEYLKKKELTQEQVLKRREAYKRHIKNPNKKKQNKYKVKYNELSDSEIKRRHDLIRGLPDKSKLKEASVLLGILPSTIGRFLKKYPIELNNNK